MCKIKVSKKLFVEQYFQFFVFLKFRFQILCDQSIDDDVGNNIATTMMPGRRTKPVGKRSEKQFENRCKEVRAL